MDAELMMTTLKNHASNKLDLFAHEKPRQGLYPGFFATRARIFATASR
jgi:hypothetical protein